MIILWFMDIFFEHHANYIWFNFLMTFYIYIYIFFSIVIYVIFMWNLWNFMRYLFAFYMIFMWFLNILMCFFTFSSHDLQMVNSGGILYSFYIHSILIFSWCDHDVNMMWSWCDHVVICCVLVVYTCVHYFNILIISYKSSFWSHFGLLRSICTLHALCSISCLPASTHCPVIFSASSQPSISGQSIQPVRHGYAPASSTTPRYDQAV